MGQTEQLKRRNKVKEKAQETQTQRNTGSYTQKSHRNMKQETTLYTICNKNLDSKNKKKIIPDKILLDKCL